jgi:hypothetical protein
MKTVFVLWLLLTGSPNVGILNGVYASLDGCHHEEMAWIQTLGLEQATAAMRGAMEFDKAVCVPMSVQSLGGKDNYAGEVYVLVVMPLGAPNLRTPQAGILTGVYRAGSDCDADAARNVANGQRFFCGSMNPKP